MERHKLNGFAVDLGGTKIAFARIVSGEVVDRRQTATRGEASGQEIVNTIFCELDALGFNAGSPLGVAVSGRLDDAGHWHAVNTSTLSGVAGFPLGAEISSRGGQATRCSNDAIAAAYAEAAFGAGMHFRRFGYLTVSTGVGGAIVIDGHPMTSPNGLAGHVGFVSSRHSDVRCGSGRVGTVESRASGRALAAAAARLGHHGLDGRAIFAAAETEAWALSLIEDSAGAIATLTADLVAMLGLDVMAIGGSIGLAPGYLEHVKLALQNEPDLFHIPVVPAHLGHDGPLLGALGLAQEDGLDHAAHD